MRARGLCSDVKVGEIYNWLLSRALGAVQPPPVLPLRIITALQESCKHAGIGRNSTECPFVAFIVFDDPLSMVEMSTCQLEQGPTIPLYCTSFMFKNTVVQTVPVRLSRGRHVPTHVIPKLLHQRPFGGIVSRATTSDVGRQSLGEPHVHVCNRPSPQWKLVVRLLEPFDSRQCLHSGPLLAMLTYLEVGAILPWDLANSDLHRPALLRLLIQLL
ncbi:hypothetical protein V8C44DRAFT_249753 [Trichoderma aethiopicum]